MNIFLIIICILLSSSILIFHESFAEIISDNSNNLEIQFIHLGGKGESILLKANDKYVLIDGGKEEDYPILKESLKNTIDFDHKKGNQLLIDFVIATHNHNDHTGGIARLLDDEEFKIENLWLAKYQGSNDPSIDYIKIWELIDHAENHLLVDNTTIFSQEIRNNFPINFSILSPPENGIEEYTACEFPVSIQNDNSLIILLNFENYNILFGGDASCHAEQFLLSTDEIKSLKGKIFIMNAFHHGIDHSLTKQFIEYIKPKIAVSSRIDDRYPTEEAKIFYRESNTTLLSTINESIFILINKDGCKYSNKSIIETTDTKDCDDSNQTITQKIPPLKQIKMETTFENILCKENFILLIKLSDKSPACVTFHTSEKLILRGWGEFFYQ